MPLFPLLLSAVCQLPALRRVLRLLAGLLLLGCALGAGAAMPEAGSIIQNQASAEYRHANGSLVSIQSNRVTIQVAAVESLLLVQDLQVESSAGARVSLPHVLTNTGNLDLAVTLQFASLAGNDFELTAPRVVRDGNGNGIADAGEAELVLGSAFLLARGEQVALILTASVPASATHDSRGRVQLTASTPGGSSASVTDQVTVINQRAPQLTKSVSPQSAQPGALLRYSLVLDSGDGWAPASVSVDGVAQSLLLVRDSLPANTQFSAFVQDSGAIRLYHLAGDGQDSYTRSAPADLSRVDAIAFGFAAQPANTRLSMQFDLQLSRLASGDVSNIAEVRGQVASVPRSVDSNIAVVSVPLQPGLLDYRDPALQVELSLTQSGQPLNLMAEAGVCNTSATRVETWPLSLSALVSGDVENLTITETGPNTGIFVLTSVPTSPWPQYGQVSNDGTVQVALSDTVNASMSCNGNVLLSTILIDPGGVVFDSRSNQPVAGARVSLIQITAGGEQPATVFDFDGKPAPSTVTTAADGHYSFPLVPAGNYRLQVTPPNGYSFPSALPAAELPAGRRIGDGSYGRQFSISSAVLLDIPLDTAATSGLALEKIGSRSEVEIGESLRYSLRVTNSTGQDLQDVVIDDQLPAGFSYLKGSTSINGRRSSDPQVGAGRSLRFQLGDLARGKSAKLTYSVQVGSGATAGDGVNRAQAFSGHVQSNRASHAVEISKGVFADEAYIVGKVYADCDRNQIQDQGEPGIPGVRLYLDDGSYVITDGEGKYSFYGVAPRTHSLRLDRITLPRGAQMQALANRNAGDALSRFVDLRNGELHRADFAEGSCAADVMQEVDKRRKEAAAAPASASEEEGLTRHLRTKDSPTQDVRARPASGLLDSAGRILPEEQKPLTTSSEARSQARAAAPEPASRAMSVSLEKLLLSRKDNRFGFMDLKDGDVLPGSDLSVRLAGRDGSLFRLLVNGEEVAQNRIGQRARMPTQQLMAWEYIGVKLQPGRNQLKAEALDPFGNVREKAEISLIAPGRAARLRIVVPPQGGTADGQTPLPVVVRLQDADGVPVAARTLITLETSSGRWDVEDMDPLQEGVQTSIQGGEALFDLLPPSEPGTTRLRVSSGQLSTDERATFTPYLRPLIATGVIEGAIGLNRLSADALAAPDAGDQFEQDIRSLNGSAAGNSQFGARGSMFLKGKVRGDYLLTLAYDSDKDTRDRLFRDIEPENFYPVYGDSATKGFDAQSTSPLYVRIDKGRSYLLYGDFTTAADTRSPRQLSNYSRSLTGVYQHLETDRVVVNLFASHDSARQQVQEFRAQGISGPYRLAGSGFVRNSEQIQIIVRDRSQPSVVLETRTLSRFVDYTVDELAGTIMFSRPVASVDDALNPVYIRISWEVESGGDAFWVYGADGSYRLTEQLEVGASAVRNDDPVEGSSLYGIHARLTMAEDHTLTLEAARSDADLGLTGDAWRAEWLRAGTDLEGRVFIGQSDKGFENASSTLSAGRREMGANIAARLSQSTRLKTEALHTESLETSGRRQGLYAGLEYSLTSRLAVEGGLRFTQEDAAAALSSGLSTGAREVTSGYGKLDWNPEILSRANLYTEYEQDMGDSANRMFALGGAYQLSQRGRLYARHELISSLSGAFGLSELSEEQNTTVFGLDFDYLEDGNVFSEYRVRNAVDGPTAQAASGLRNGWALQPGLRLTTQFERVQPLDGLSEQNSAIALGLQYTANPLWKGGTRLEWRQGDSESSLLHTVSYIRKIDEDWSFLGKNTVSLIERDSADSGDLLRNRLRLGLAWRQSQINRWSWLGRYESRYDDDEQEGERRHAHVLSSHVNFQPDADWVFSGRHAAKLVRDDNGDVDSAFTGQLVSGRVLYDITEQWDVGVTASSLFDGGSRRNGYGVETGYLLAKNLWVSVGYNFSGYYDRDFEDVDYTRQGPYLRLRFKFDETHLGWLE